MSHEIPNLHPTEEPWHGVPRPLSCGHEPTPNSGLGTGYAITPDGDYLCYACADERILADIAAARPGDRAPGLYLSNDNRTITSWSGGTIMRLVQKGTRHNFSRDRFYLTARDASGRTWYGTGAPGQYCTLRLTRS